MNTALLAFKSGLMISLPLILSFLPTRTKKKENYHNYRNGLSDPVFPGNFRKANSPFPLLQSGKSPRAGASQSAKGYARLGVDTGAIVCPRSATRRAAYSDSP